MWLTRGAVSAAKAAVAVAVAAETEAAAQTNESPKPLVSVELCGSGPRESALCLGGRLRSAGPKADQLADWLAAELAGYWRLWPPPPIGSDIDGWPGRRQADDTAGAKPDARFAQLSCANSDLAPNKSAAISLEPTERTTRQRNLVALHLVACKRPGAKTKLT